MSRPKIFLITMQPARMPGMGGEVRSYYFIKTATELGDVTLVSLGGPDGKIGVQRDIAELCETVIEPQMVRREAVPKSSSSRLDAAVRTMRVLFTPWSDNWTDFLAYCIQHCPPNQSVQNKNVRWTRRMLAAVLRAEFNFFASFGKFPPLNAFLFNNAYKAIEPAALEILKQRNFDLIWIENTLTFPFAKRLLKNVAGRKSPVVCNAHNVETLVQERVVNNVTNEEERRFFRIQAKLMRTLELDAYQSSDLVLQCSEQDANLARTMSPGTEFCVVGNGVNVDYFRPREGETPHDRPTLVFTAGFGYGPNREALEYFIRDVFPKVVEACPSVRFVYAGSQAQEMMHLHRQNDAIECYSSPEDIRPYFEQAWVYVVPLLVGGGTRLKILEAMSMRRAIVSTSIGAEGIPCVDGEHIVFADSPEQFAREVVNLLNDRDRREQLAQAADAWVRENYAWEQLCDQAKSKLQAYFAASLSPKDRVQTKQCVEATRAATRAEGARV